MPNTHQTDPKAQILGPGRPKSVIRPESDQNRDERPK